jgi:hypothetical protein
MVIAPSVDQKREAQGGFEWNELLGASFGRSSWPQVKGLDLLL